MKLLCLSNGHGEDAIAVRILLELQAHEPDCSLAALPIVGEGHAYLHHQIPLAGPTQSMPSGGFIYMDGRQFARDMRKGLLKLTWKQLQVVRAWSKSGGFILAVGDIVPLLFAWWSGAPYAFVGTAKSEYYLRDERGLLPRRSWVERLENWSGSVYLPWERWLMSHKRCQAVFLRDQLTTEILKKWDIPAVNLGNPMMDGLAPMMAFSGPNDESIPGTGASTVDAAPDRPLTFVLLPGSRSPEAYDNWQILLQAVSALVSAFWQRSLLFLGAIAPGLDLEPFQQNLDALGWRVQPGSNLEFTQRHATLALSQSSFHHYLHQADFALAMSGTATEQFVGLGKPAITISGKGPQFTSVFAEAQTRLLGPSVTMIHQPMAVVSAVQSLLNDPDRLQLIADNGRTRMGEPGAARRIAHDLIERLNHI